MATALTPAIALTAFADEGTDDIEDGYYSADVEFDCAFAMGTVQASFENALADDQAVVDVEDGTAYVTVSFGEGDFIMNGRTMTGTNIYLSDSYTARGATDATDVEIATCTTQDGEYVEVQDYDIDPEGVISSITFEADPDVDTYYLQTGISGAQGMAFPYTTSAGATYYASISLDWDSIADATPGFLAGMDAGNYDLSASLMNATDITSASMAASAIDSAAAVVDDEGNIEVIVNVAPVTVKTVTAYCKDIKVFPGDNTTDEADDADVLATDIIDDVEYPTQIAFYLNNDMVMQGGTYISMYVPAMNRTVTAFLAFDFSQSTAMEATTFTQIYTNLGLTVSADDYDVISSATGLTNGHAKDLPSITATATNGQTREVTNRDGSTTVKDCQDIVGANLVGLKSAQEVKLASAEYEYTSQYGDGEFILYPDDTVEGYVWNEYLNSIYAVTVSDGTSTAGAVPWIDYYGENATSGYHYNKIEIAMNNGTSPHDNAAEVNRFAAFYADGASQISAGTYTVTVYAEGYAPLTAEVPVLTTYAGTVTASKANTVSNSITLSNLPSATRDNPNAGIADAKASVSYTTGAGRSAVTTYMAQDADVVNNTVALDADLLAAVEAGTTLNVTVTSSNFAPISCTTTVAEVISYSVLYGEDMGLDVSDEAYDAVSSATNYSSFHAKDIPGNCVKTTDTEGNTAIVGVTAPDEAGTKAVELGSATYSYSSKYGTGEFAICPDDTVEGYTWNDYLSGIYAVTVSCGDVTVGALPWIDFYGESATQGAHYNKVEIAMNNGTSLADNEAEVTRFADFYADGASQISAGTYTITIYSEDYLPLTAEVEVLPTYADEVSVAAVDGVNDAAISGLPADIEDATATISFSVGQGRDAKTYYFAQDAEVVDGKVAVSLPELPEGTELAEGQALSVTINSSNYAPISATATYAAYVAKQGWVKATDDSWSYYVDDTAQIGWFQVKGTYYYAGADGVMQTGWLKYNNKWYYLKSSGAMATGWCKVGTTYYYFASSGKMLTGWQKVSGSWYYLKSSGAMATGWVKISGYYYYFGTNGKMCASQWVKSSGKWYYLKASGKMAASETLTISGKSYTFAANGVMK